MAGFPSLNTGLTLEEALALSRRASQWIKGSAQNQRNAMAAGSYSAASLLALLDNLRGAHDQLLLAASVPGIAEYAAAQIPNGKGVDIGPKFATMMAAIDAAGAWIISNFPKDAQGRLLSETWGVDGARVPVTFASGDTASLRTLLDAVIAAID